MAKPNSEISENNGRFFGSLTSSAPFKSLLLKSKQKSISNSNRRSRLRPDSENIAPLDPNVQYRDPPISATTSFPKKSPSKLKAVNIDNELVAKPLIKEKLKEARDPPVKVVVRIRPANGASVRRVSKEAVSVDGRKYSFDSVLDSNSTQGDVYELVGAPLVKDALSGYNTSVIAYGQTGSGKTYTMWGPPSAMVEGPSIDGLQGVVPRIFQNLFSQIQKEQESPDRQINYQCRCSFLEVYDEKIGDLIDPTQRNLEIKDDPKNGFYVENLTEEYVSSYEDVTQILIKGLSNRKMGATCINSKSSRSHIMFTCIIESWCKESSSKCFGTSKTSRISLVDLAGYERNVLDHASKQHVKEGKYIKKSTSHLGHLINILAEGSQTGKSEEVPYRSSRLTHLLRESFGGNAKLCVLCAISPDNKNASETLSTLRFGLRARLMKNEPVVNVITEDDVNDLSDQIRQLKEELMRAKSSACSSISSSDNEGYFSRRNVRESLNQLRQSLNRSLILPRIGNDADEELSINEEDVKELRLQFDKISSFHEENSKEDSEMGESSLLYSAEDCKTNLTCEHYLSCDENDESDIEEINSGETHIEPEEIADLPPLLQDPVLSESPKIKNIQRRSVVFSSSDLSNQNDAVPSSENLDMLRKSYQPVQLKSSLRSSRVFPSPTENLAASLHRGLQLLDYHQKSSASTRSSVSFSFEHLALKPCLSSDKIAASIQTLPENGQPDSFVCTKCEGKEVDATDGIKDVERDLALAIQREMELTNTCKEQAAEIEHLNQQLKQYKCENAKGPNSSNSSNGMNQLQAIDEDEKEELDQPNSENKLLTWKGDENPEPEFIKEKCEIKEVQKNLTLQKSFGSEERETLLQEIELLKNKLKFHTDAPVRRSSDNLRASLLSQSMQLRKSTTFFSQGNSNSREEFEKEREKWMEMESEWISLTDELRIDIESNRERAEKVEMELRLEKKCTEELDDALKRSVLCHARMVEHYVDLQEKYNDVVSKHRAIMEGVAEVKRAATKAGAKGRHGSRFTKALAAELSALRVERERERELLKKENRSLKMQLKDTAEAVHAAGELLVRLREAEETASLAEGKNTSIEDENEKLKKQVEKLKRKHKMEMITMKQYLAESRLPEAALRPNMIYREDSVDNSSTAFHVGDDDDQAWRAEFGAIYQDHHY